MKKRKKKNGAKRWPLGFGLLYVMACLPRFWVVKIGITGVGVLKRARGIDEEMPGVPVPFAFAPLPFAFPIEQGLHALCEPLKYRFHRGSGHTETFWLPAAVPALGVITGTWAFYLWAIDTYFNTRLLAFFGGLLLSILR